MFVVCGEALFDVFATGDTPTDITPEELTAVPTIACDCLVKEIETRGTETPWGWRLGQSENIDHHAPVDRMARVISSTNLALLRVAAHGIAAPDTRVLITHTDCDSILSAGIITGRLQPLPHYGEPPRPRATRERRGLPSRRTRDHHETAIE